MKNFNPVFWIMWLLPGAAVVAGLTTLGIALKSGDRALPEDYHWEGARLDADFSRARTAAAMGIEVTLSIRGGACSARLRNLSIDPVALNLLLTNGTDAGLDRRVRLPRIGGGEYRAACAPLESGKWRISLDDDSLKWGLRGTTSARFESLELRARNPEGPAP
jgi:uncharacterized protein